jgi:hypothetical protein
MSVLIWSRLDRRREATKESKMKSRTRRWCRYENWAKEPRTSLRLPKFLGPWLFGSLFIDGRFQVAGEEII